MIKVNKGVVEFPEGFDADSLLKDTMCVITTFVKISKNAKISDEIIEHALIGMVNDAFSQECIAFEKDGDDINANFNFGNGDNT